MKFKDMINRRYVACRSIADPKFLASPLFQQKTKYL